MKFRFTPFILLVALIFSQSFQAQAQDEDPYKDLLFLIIDGDYEKAASKAERITEKDDTRREPVPYIYASMAYYEMSKDDKYAEDYPRAFREAIKNAYKAARYDDENLYLPEHATYMNELKAAIMREAMFQYESESYRKSTTYTKYVTRIDPYDISALLLKGVAEERGRNSYQAEKTFQEADTTLKHLSAEEIPLDARKAYRFAVIEYAKLMKEQGKKEKAQPFLDAVAGIFEDDAEFQDVYSSY